MMKVGLPGQDATIVPMWGDGSGSGTDGTFAIPGGLLRMWKGRWSPIVYTFSSNWKELSTLKLSLRRIKEEDAEYIRGTAVFYFTDNFPSYWIAGQRVLREPRNAQVD
jgi:hypothetical protein